MERENPVTIDSALAEKGIYLNLYWGIFKNFDNTAKKYDLSDVSEEIADYLRSRFDLAGLKDMPVFKDFRSFYWDKLGIDPTKRRPAGEALVRRVLNGKGLPSINLFVDAYNWASAYTGIPISAYDMDTFKLPITIRFAREGEILRAIGGKEIAMKGNEIVIVSDDGIVMTQFPYRDSDVTKVGPKTRNILVIVLGIESIPQEKIKIAFDRITHNVNRCKVDSELQKILGAIKPDSEGYISNRTG